MATSGFLGIDAGTQGLSVIFTNENREVLAVGEGSYEMVPGLPEQCYEQSPQDWTTALQQASRQLKSRLSDAGIDPRVLAIGISGQMHGEVLVDGAGQPLSSARLWCDGRNESEGNELTSRFGVKMPKRATAARWLWTVRNQADKAQHARHMTTPAGWLSYQLTGEWTLGVGDASGMFPIDTTTGGYRADLLREFAAFVAGIPVSPMEQLLPDVRRAGELAGRLNERGAELLDLAPGIPVAPAEGDQPAALAGSLIGAAGMVSVSFGTSVCANSVGNRDFDGVSTAVDHFCAVDGQPINMVWLRNGTTYMNTLVDMFAQVMGGERAAGFAAVIPQIMSAPADCGGLLALPFMDDEPGLGVSRGGTASIVGLNADNATPGNIVKAGLLATMFNLRLGSEVLDRQGFPRAELVLTGGLTKSPELGQLLADVFQTPVSIPATGEEGTAWGATLLAEYTHTRQQASTRSWPEFLTHLPHTPIATFAANPQRASEYAASFERYKRFVESQPVLQKAVG